MAEWSPSARVSYCWFADHLDLSRTYPIAFAGVAASMCWREVRSIQRVATLRQADQVVRCSGEPMIRPDSGEAVIDGSVAEHTRDTVRLTVGHAFGLCFPPA
jgi:hypothetical protein